MGKVFSKQLSVKFNSLIYFFPDKSGFPGIFFSELFLSLINILDVTLWTVETGFPNKYFIQVT